MSKNSSDHLFFLIKAMTQNEKRAFKMFVGRHKSGEQSLFVRLFDLIDKQRVYDEEQLLQSDKQIKKTQLSNLKHNLYQQVMLSLRNSARGHDIDIQIHHCIDDALILHNKCLHEQCLRMIQKARHLAEKFHRSVFLFELAELEKKISGKEVCADNIQRLHNLMKQSKHAIQQLSNINAFTNLAFFMEEYYLASGYLRYAKDYDSLQQLLRDYLPNYIEAELTTEERLYLHQGLTHYNFLVQDFIKAAHHASQLLQLFDKHPMLMESFAELYLKAIHLQLKALSKLNKIELFEQEMKRFVVVKQNINITKNLAVLLFKYESLNAINFYFLTGNFWQGSRIIQPIRLQLEKYTSLIDGHTLLIFYYKFGCMYFGMEEYRQASEWFMKIIQTRDELLRTDIQAFARILNLICSYELADDEQVDYEIKNTYRYLLAHGELQKYNTHILSFLKSLPGINPFDLNKHFKKLLNDLKPLQKDPYEKRAFIYFDIISWLESKLTNRTVQDVIMSKVKR